jgi:hypothetical protein
MKPFWGRSLTLAGIMLLSGCQAARMPVPDALSATERLPVQGRQGWKIKEHVRFGAYQAHTIDRSWVRGSDLQVLAYDGSKRKQHYTFLLREGQTDRWRVSCQAFLRRQALSSGGLDVELKNRSELECWFFSVDTPTEEWHLTLTERGERPLNGTLSKGSTMLEVEGTRALQQGLRADATTGYQILDAGQPIGAVEVVNDGAVWLRDEARTERRGVLPATMAALLLLEDLRAHLPDEAL